MTDASPQSTWGRLRRRKVVQWGLAYVAGAWGLLQGLSYATATFHWPERLQQTATILLLIVLPVALVVAWYHGDKGAQRVTRTEVAILVLLVLVGGGLFWRFERANELQANARSPTRIAGAADGNAPPTVGNSDVRPSIAVLPFENRSSNRDDVYFVDGIHDDILTQLSKLSGLKVISRTSVERFRDTKLPTSDIASQLHVKNILEGGVQRAGDRVRINVQLIDAKSDTHLWADTYDRELTAANIFAIQSEVATAIAAALKAALTPAEKGRTNKVPTRNLEAWEAYQLGRQRLARRNSEAFGEAEKYFRHAIALDPGFALAYSGLADTLALRLFVADAPIAESIEQAQAAAGKALSLDPELSEAWASSALIDFYRQDTADSQVKLRRAIELDPNNVTALKNYGMNLLQVPRVDEAHQYLGKAAELDPLSSIVQVNLAQVFEAKGNFDAANQCFRRALEIDPAFSAAYLGLGFTAAWAQDRFPDALALTSEAIALDANDVIGAIQKAVLHVDLGDEPAFLAAGRELVQRWPNDFRTLMIMALAERYEGRSSTAVARAERALESFPRNQLPLLILRDDDVRTGKLERAVARYRKSYPEFFGQVAPTVDFGTFGPAIDLAFLLQKQGDREGANALLNASEAVVRAIPRVGSMGYGIADVQIYAIRGENDKALAALHDAVRTGWRGPFWRYERDFDASLDSIRTAPEFEAAFSIIEKDMARQRAELAAVRKATPPNPGSPSVRP